MPSPHCAASSSTLSALALTSRTLLSCSALQVGAATVAAATVAAAAAAAEQHVSQQHECVIAVYTSYGSHICNIQTANFLSWCAHAHFDRLQLSTHMSATAT